jgi:FkbM family methyltransferase
MKKILKRFLEKSNYMLIRKESVENLINDQKLRLRSSSDFTQFFLYNSINDLMILKDCLLHTKSQIKQDLFVISTLQFKENGFFVEFGATNGIDLSNTFLLEKHFNWSGILAEPGKVWHNELTVNRSCNIEKSCVWKSTGDILQFNQVDSPELSTINDFNNCDVHSDERLKGTLYNVETITLSDLLNKYNAPKVIDYLSIDTEGSEYEILLNFDFSKYNFRIITCEHNFSSNREKIYRLLTKNGYQRIYENYSQFDDWYIYK